jgi:integrase
MEQFITWYCSEPRLALNRAVVLRFRLYLESLGLAAGTINQRLAAVRRLAYEAADSGLLSPELAAGIRRIKGVKQLGARAGNWLTRDQARALLEIADGEGPRASRDLAMISVLLGCGLRRAELSALEVDDLQIRQGHWAIVDLVGKGGHVRTVPMPLWVKAAIDRWISAANVKAGRIFRAVSRHGTSWGKGISENVIWYVVRGCAERMQLDHLAPHDLRRTCAKLCHASGGELEQIQFLLGHVSVLTTERYLGCKQNLEDPSMIVSDVSSLPGPGPSIYAKPCCQELRFDLGESLDVGRSQGRSQQINRRSPARPFPVLPHHRRGLLPLGSL